MAITQYLIHYTGSESMSNIYIPLKRSLDGAPKVPYCAKVLRSTILQIGFPQDCAEKKIKIRKCSLDCFA